MKLYHGTNQDIASIDPKKGLRNKDFGQGFYLTPDYNTARRMAMKRARLFGGRATVIEYQLDESCMSNGELNVLEFPRKATEEWAKFVDYNRTKIDAGRTHCYDIVVGPIANDGVAYLLGRYHEGTMTLRELAKDLQDKFLDMQYMFATERAIKCLMKTQIKDIAI